MLNNSISNDLIDMFKEVNKEYSMVMNFMRQIYDNKKNTIIFDVDLSDDNFVNDIKNRLNNLVKTKNKSPSNITLTNILRLINNQNSLLNVSNKLKQAYLKQYEQLVKKIDFYKDYRKNYKEYENHKNCKFCERIEGKILYVDLQLDKVLSYSILSKDARIQNNKLIKIDLGNEKIENQEILILNSPSENDIKMIKQNKKDFDLNLDLVYEKINEIFIESKIISMNNKEIDLILTESITFSENNFNENNKFDLNQNFNEIINKSIHSKTIFSDSDRRNNKSITDRNNESFSQINSQKSNFLDYNIKTLSKNPNSIYELKNKDDFFDIKNEREIDVIDSIKRNNINKIDNSFSLNSSNYNSTSVTWKKINEVKKVVHKNDKKSFLKINNKVDLLNYK